MKITNRISLATYLFYALYAYTVYFLPRCFTKTLKAEDFLGAILLLFAFCFSVVATYQEELIEFLNKLKTPPFWITQRIDKLIVFLQSSESYQPTQRAKPDNDDCIHQERSSLSSQRFQNIQNTTHVVTNITIGEIHIAPAASDYDESPTTEPKATILHTIGSKTYQIPVSFKNEDRKFKDLCALWNSWEPVSTIAKLLDWNKRERLFTQKGTCSAVSWRFDKPSQREKERPAEKISYQGK